MDKNTIFSKNSSINCGGKLISLDKPLIMAILNINQNSFYDGGKYTEESKIIARIEKVISEGADIIDIGFVSTRPGEKISDPLNEKKRLIPIAKLLVKKFHKCIFSVDTYHSEVAAAAIEEGVHIVNDISGGTIDKKMFEVIAKYNVPYVLSHIKGIPENMQLNPTYENILNEMSLFFSDRINKLKELGVCDIIIDPGFGFGKNIEHNYLILKNLNFFKSYGFPVLVGLSRKSMLNKFLNITPEHALNATTIANTIALINGASILRVHDVAEARQAIKIINFIENLNE